MERYACVHGHFYQPPRENPWLEAIEQQVSAYPFHDWNERITRECYAPNAAARILDGEGHIERIRNNYSRISFNFGPTLLSWLEAHDPETYRAILEADAVGARRYGQGSAMAQAYNHIIMPLANERDKRTQVRWGLRDFEHRFQRRPDGMWLPETAADTATLEALAREGIRFTILAPSQCLRVRELEAPDHAWQEVGAAVDPTQPYLVRLPSGRSLTVFFYDGPVSHDVAFKGLLSDGRRFVDRFVQGFPADDRPGPALVHIATDGETYGHHQRHGDMALAFALRAIRKEGHATVTNYASFLALQPPRHEAEIRQATSWSCEHGVERWRSDCGCNGGKPGWHQRWRAPLRDAFDWLRDEMAPHYEREAGRLLQDPWAARDAYIDVVLDRGDDALDRFFAEHAVRPLDAGQQVRALKLLEMQRHLMLMYTSCGWFFDEVTGLETTQVLRYAGRVVQLAQDTLDVDPEPRFLELLATAPSNLREHGDAARVYRKWIKPVIVDLRGVASHYAVSSMFEDPGPTARVYAFDVERLEERRSTLGGTRAALGRARVRSRITREEDEVTYLVLHMGGLTLHGGVRQSEDPEAFAALGERVWPAFDSGDVAELVRIVDAEFQGGTYSLRSLFRDQQRRILQTVLTTTMTELEAVYRQAYERHAPMMRLLADLGAPPPKTLAATAELVINAELRNALAADPIDAPTVQGLVDAARRANVALDRDGLAYTLRSALERLAEDVGTDPLDGPSLQRLEHALHVAAGLPFEVDLWLVQNRFYGLLRTQATEQRTRAAAGDEEATAWLREVTRLGNLLNIGMAPAA